MTMQTQNKGIFKDNTQRIMLIFKKPLRIFSLGPEVSSFISHNKSKAVM